jgi:hypothetical protein
MTDRARHCVTTLVLGHRAAVGLNERSADVRAINLLNRLLRSVQLLLVLDCTLLSSMHAAASPYGHA